MKFKLYTNNYISSFLLIWVFKLFKVKDLNKLKLKEIKVDFPVKIGSLFLDLFLLNLIHSTLIIVSCYWLFRGLYSEYAIVYAFAMLIANLLALIAYHNLILKSTLIASNLKSTILSKVYLKSLKLVSVTDISTVLNLVSADSNRIAEAIVNCNFLWSCILECILISAFAFADIGIPALPIIFLILFILLPLSYFISQYTSKFTFDTSVLMTRRIFLMSELLTTIKLIKFYSWERFYLEKVDIHNPG